MCVTSNNPTQVKTSRITGLDKEPNRLSNERKNRKGRRRKKQRTEHNVNEEDFES